jgi:hypothetical protein
MFDKVLNALIFVGMGMMFSILPAIKLAELNRPAGNAIVIFTGIACVGLLPWIPDIVCFMARSRRQVTKMLWRKSSTVLALIEHSLCCTLDRGDCRLHNLKIINGNGTIHVGDAPGGRHLRAFINEPIDLTYNGDFKVRFAVVVKEYQVVDLVGATDDDNPLRDDPKCIQYIRAALRVNGLIARALPRMRYCIAK